MRRKPPKTRHYVLWGVILGTAAGVVEPMVAAIGEADYWATVGIYVAQIGGGGCLLGALIGLALARRAQRRCEERRAKGLCINCGYDLTGNVSGRCPECGTAVGSGSGAS
ncbi:MAG TPA: hypothetical protein VM487_20670 [Phycisphaerae bacterium]|nr:hypothetical protein [Phycisphaerae bacterium]